MPAKSKHQAIGQLAFEQLLKLSFEITLKHLCPTIYKLRQLKLKVCLN